MTGILPISIDALLPGIEPEHLRGDRPLPPVPARNRRIGELFKDLHLAEGRGTGVPKIYRSMRDNGSPEPRFDFDPGRTYFRTILPAHPEYVALSALREAAYLKATGDLEGALQRLKSARASRPESALLAATLIRELADRHDLDSARQIYQGFSRQVPGFAGVAAAMADAFLSANRQQDAKEVLDEMPDVLTSREAFDAAILERRAGRQEQAHHLFQRAGDSVLGDVRAAHEFAQTKMHLAGKLIHRRPRRGANLEARARLLAEAEQLLERVVRMEAPATRKGWAWFDLGRIRRWLQRPQADVRAAFDRAVAACPTEERFRNELRKLDAS